MKITIIGAGNMGGAIARGLAKGSLIKETDITCTAQSERTLCNLRDTNPGFTLTTDNIEAVRGADMIFLAVKPWRMEEVIDQIKDHLDYDKQIVASVAGGITFDKLDSFFSRKNSSGYKTYSLPTLFRVIPNTAVEVLSSMTLVSAYNASPENSGMIVDLFNELGHAMLVEEKLMSVGTALASCGIAFALRYIRAAMEGGVEMGIYPKDAQEIVAYTVRGAADLLLEHKSNPEAEIDKVTTPGGITIKGLNEMERAGFTSSVIRGLKASK